MDGYTNIKRPPPSMNPLYDAMPVDDTCHDHCVTLNGPDLEKLAAGMPERGDLVHFSAMGRVVEVHDTAGHRSVRVEIEEVLFVEDETKEGEGDGEK